MIPIDDFTFTADLEIEAAWSFGFPGTRETPEEPEGYELEAVYWRGVDITGCLSEKDLRRIEEQLRDSAEP